MPRREPWIEEEEYTRSVRQPTRVLLLGLAASHFMAGKRMMSGREPQ